MIQTFITIFVIITVIALWTISTQRKLAMLDENTSSAINQIGTQIASRFDALRALLDFIKSYAKNESEALIETIKSRRNVITAKSKPDEIMCQEGVISETLDRIAMLTEQYPDLKADQNYIKTMDALKAFENMVRISCLIYNDSVAKLNREIRMFPATIVARMMGFRQREYLVEQADKEDMPE